MPPYIIEPPDILQIDALDVVPKPPYRVRPLDTLLINATGTLPRNPVEGTYQVDPEGNVNLGRYGIVQIAGLSLEEAGQAITKQMRLVVANPQVTVALATSRALQLIRGPHLVNQDGTVSLGLYGSVTVAGLTVNEAKEAIQLHLSQYLLNPEVSVITTGFNSKYYYVIIDGGAQGHSILKAPITGSDTVLDAITSAGGMPAQGSNKHVWIARPSPIKGCDQILPVDMMAIMRKGEPFTNYVLLPNDRVYIKAHSLFALNNALNLVLAPIERISGTILLGISTVETIKNPSNVFNGFGF
jgi:protein involved in polysaccharide export with SLBB domain